MVGRSRILEHLVLVLLGTPVIGCGTLPALKQSIAATPPSLSLLDVADPRPSGSSLFTVSRNVNDSIPDGRGSEESQDEPLPVPRRLDESMDEWEDGSADGLSLDAAIERLLSANPELAAQFQDIPKARADILTAGLHSDPVVFLTASPIPYGRYSAQRPGATTYDITFVQPLDLSGKHRTNKRVAEKYVPILEAHYQDAVRLEIDRLFTVYVNVLEARATARAAQASLQHLAEAEQRRGEQDGRDRLSQTDKKRLSIRRARARIALRQAEATLVNALRNMSVLLAIPAEEADRLRIHGSLHDRAPPPPTTEELIEIARHARPDLLALQLSVDRARAELRREKAEAVDDFFLFFSPYQLVDLTPQGNQIANSWELGLMIPIPSLNRNQGEIARARVNVSQWRTEVERAEQTIVDEVRRAASEYAVSRAIVQQYERDILGNLGSRRKEANRRLAEEGDFDSFLAAQRDYEETIRSYVEALARHRRSMLRLNTVVGQRILP